MKFRLKKDWYIDNFFDTVKIYDEGHIFTQDIVTGKQIGRAHV